jgi:hypothetical protein
VEGGVPPGKSDATTMTMTMTMTETETATEGSCVVVNAARRSDGRCLRGVSSACVRRAVRRCRRRHQDSLLKGRKNAFVVLPRIMYKRICEYHYALGKKACYEEAERFFERGDSSR